MRWRFVFPWVRRMPTTMTHNDELNDEFRRLELEC
jgi:hypothetical protein